MTAKKPKKLKPPVGDEDFGVAQSAERRPVKSRVVGSIPTPGAKTKDERLEMARALLVDTEYMLVKRDKVRHREQSREAMRKYRAAEKLKKGVT